MSGKKIYFASDFHLGLDAGTNSAIREKKVVKWLNLVANSAKEIYLLGDVFDFWWEYKYVVPCGFTRFLGTVASLTDSGISIHFFGGNHDMWIGKYLEKECGVVIHNKPLLADFDGRKFYLAHGEGLGSGHNAYKILLCIFRNRPLQVLYSALHPRIGMGFGHWWSKNSRLAKGISIEFMGEAKEDLFRYSRMILENHNIDYFIYGHRHLMLKHVLNNGTTIVILGDWIQQANYAEWDGETLNLINFD
ncbi:MAG: UDP-2,3-diacylglucosamine diphosphatase [Bacteroidales bacterium]